MYLLTKILGLVLLVLLLAANGDAFSRLLGTRDLLRRQPRPFRILAVWILGFAWSSSVALMLALVGLYRPGPLLLGTIALPAFVALTRARSLVRAHRVEAHRGEARVEPAGHASGRGPLSWRWSLAIGFGVLTLFVLLPTLFLSLTPTVSWDAGTYHLTLPRLYLEAGGLRQVALNVYSYWPQAVELVFGLALAIDDHALAKGLHFCSGLAVLVLLMARTHRARGTAGAEGPPESELDRPFGFLLAAGLWLATPLVEAQMRVAYVDLVVVFLFGSTHLFLERALTGPDRPTSGDRKEVDARAWLRLSGIAVGMLAATKVTGLVWAVVAVLGTLLAVGRRSIGELLRSSPTRVVSHFLVLALLIAAPWPLRSWVTTGNPFYPFWLGGPDWSPELSASFAAWQRSIGMGREPGDLLLLPLRVFWSSGPGYDHFDGALGRHWLAALPLVLLARPATHRRYLPILTLGFVVWAASSQQTRFLLPVLALLACYVGSAALDGTQRTRRRLPKGPCRARLPLAVVALVAAGWAGLSHPVARRGGLAAAGRMVTETPARIQASVRGPLLDAVSRLPPDSLILQIHTNQRYFVDRRVLADSFFEASQIADWLKGAEELGELRNRLEERGVTHVWFRPRPWHIALPPSFEDLLRASRPLARDPATGEILFEIPIAAGRTRAEERPHPQERSPRGPEPP